MIKSFKEVLLLIVGVLIGISTTTLLFVNYNEPVEYNRTNWHYNSYAARQRLDCNSTEHIDHIVALKEAFDSGAYKWSMEKKKQFANDPLNQWCLDGGLNMSKSDKDLGEWDGGSCDIRKEIAIKTREVKKKYNLEIDPAERKSNRIAMNTDC